MLTAKKNELLTRVGPGTPMGALLRRYWQPIGGASELDIDPIKPIRLLGEDLVLYRDRGGRFGRGRTLDHQPRDEPGLRRLGRPGHDRGPHAREPALERRRASR